MPYLVTGGTGYIGSYVVRDLLAAGKEVVCLQRSGVTPDFREIVGEEGVRKAKVVQGDVSDTVFLFDLIRQYGIDLIIHTGSVMPPISEQQPAYALKVNCVGTNNVLEAVRLFKLKKLIWMSAGLALGNVFELYKEPIGDDNALYRPYMMYGATKALNEFMAKLYFEKFGVDSVGFRLQRTYGIGKWYGSAGAFAEFLRKVALNIPATIEDTSMIFGHLYVEDLSKLVVRVCDAPTTKTRVFNIIESDGTNRDLVEVLRRINPAAKITLAKPEHTQDYVLSKMDCTGVRSELGWQPEYSLEQGMRKVLNYFRRKAGMAPL